MNSTLKAFIERGILASGAARVGRRRRKDDVLILAYHNVLPPGESAAGDASLHLRHSAFTGQLDLLARTHRVIPLASIFEKGDGKPRVAITFDDAYLGALTIAVPELVRRAMPATIFVAPGLLGSNTWWDLLADPVEGAVPSSTRERALSEFQGDGATILRALRSVSQPPASRVMRISTSEELAIAAAHPGISIGSHTWSHSNLAALSESQITGELESSRDWLRSRFDRYVPWLSYPYGCYSPIAMRLAESAGFVGSLRVDGGWVKREARVPVHAVPRYNVPSGLSLAGFQLRLAGIGADG